MKPHTMFAGIALGNAVGTITTDDEGLALICGVTAVICAAIAVLLAWSNR